jgi:D-glycero-D-manno-heptose 1,7-bisphosphate phosphatase
MRGLVSTDGLGLWRDLRDDTRGDASGPRPALFLDRDGTVIEHVHYLADTAEVRLIGAAADAIRRANAAGWAVVVVTNQSGVARGYFGWDAVAAVQDRMYELLASEGAAVDAAYACGHAPPDAGGPAHSEWRKPAPGMLFAAAADLGLDLGASWVAGDGAHDIGAGKAAGLRGGTLVGTGYGVRPAEREKAAALGGTGFEVRLGGPVWPG